MKHYSIFQRILLFLLFCVYFTENMFWEFFCMFRKFLWTFYSTTCLVWNIYVWSSRKMFQS